MKYIGVKLLKPDNNIHNVSIAKRCGWLRLTPPGVQEKKVRREITAMYTKNKKTENRINSGELENG